MTHYVYVLMDTRKSGSYQYGSYCFTYEPFYVGKGKGKRWKAHVADALRSQSGSHKENKIRKIISDTGDLPAVVIVADGLGEAEAFSLESALIALIGRSDCGSGPLTNKSDGGEGQTGYRHSEETKALLRQKSVEYVRLHGNGFAGKHHTEEAKSKKREASKRAWSDPAKRAAVSAKYAGEGNPNYGRKHSPEEIQKMRDAKKKYYADNPEAREASRLRMRQLNEHLPLAHLVTPEGLKRRGAASRARWADPNKRQQMQAKMGKLWEVTSPDGSVSTVKSLRGHMLELGHPASSASNLASYGSWRGWKARKVE